VKYRLVEEREGYPTHTHPDWVYDTLDDAQRACNEKMAEQESRFRLIQKTNPKFPRKLLSYFKVETSDY